MRIFFRQKEMILGRSRLNEPLALYYFFFATTLEQLHTAGISQTQKQSVPQSP